MAPQKKRAVSKRRTTGGASLTGAGSGALLLSLLQGHTEPWARVLTYFAPSLSIGVSVVIEWLLRSVDDYVRERRQQQKFLVATRIAQEVLQNERSTAPQKEMAQQLLIRATQYQLKDAERQLSEVY